MLRKVLASLAAAACLAVSAGFLIPLLAQWSLSPDFTVLWTAGRFALSGRDAYDIEAVTAAQSWIRDHGLAPFSYPPTALPLFVPFALLPFWFAYWLWVALSLVLFYAASSLIVSSRATLLAIASPPCILVLILGQTTLIVGAALIFGLSLLRSRPFLAGMLFGAAAAVKPQSFLLAPIAFAAGRHWQAFTGVIVGASAMILLSLPFGLWPNWVAGLGQFQTMIDGYGLNALGATPAMLARSLGFQPLPFQLAGAAVGSWLVWHAFRSGDDHERLLAFVAGCLLASPYAMRYEIAMLAPVAAAALLRGTPGGLMIGCPLFALNVFTAVPALIVSATNPELRPR